MSIYYDGSHSITFWELYNMLNDSEYSEPIDSWEDLHLIPLTRPDVVVPEPNLRILQIPGTNKRIDITNKLPGKLTFGKRQGQWQFAINHEKYDSWVKSYNRLRSNIHGKRMMFRLNDDPSKIYYGEIVIVGYSPEANYTMVTIQYDLDKGQYKHSDAINPDIPSPSFPDNPSIYISIRFIGRTKNIIETQYKLYGESVTPPEPPEESGYRFRRWSPDIHPVTGNQDYYAQYDVVENPSPEPGPGPSPSNSVTYKFTYVNPTTQKTVVITSGTVQKGETPTEPDYSKIPKIENKVFHYWNPEVGAITKNTEFKAIYVDKPDHIDVTIPPRKLNYVDGEIIDYTGIQVKAYLKNGDYFISKGYTGGIIPPEELIFPVAAASSDGIDMTLNDLTKWGKYNAPSTNITNDENGSHVHATLVPGLFEKVVRDIAVERNTDYVFTLTFSSSGITENNNPPKNDHTCMVVMSRMPRNVWLSNQSANVIAKTDTLSNGTYRLPFNSGNNEIVYLVLDWAAITDNTTVDLTYSDIYVENWHSSTSENTQTLPVQWIFSKADPTTYETSFDITVT